MAIIDSQVHAYEANTPKRPWHSVPNWPATSPATRWWRRWTRSASTARSSSPPSRMYRYDASYAVEVQRAHPGRFGHRQAGRPGRPGGGRGHRRVEADARRGRRPHHAAEGGRARRRTIRASTGSCARRRAARFPGQHPVLGQPRRRHRADRPPSRDALHPRPSRHPAAARAARAAAALGGPAQGAGARQAPERGDQGQRRLHAVARALSVRRTSGTRWPACSMPGVSSAACGAPTGPAPSRS